LDRLSEADRLLAVLPESDPSVRARRAQLMLDRGDLTTAEAILSTGPAGDSNFAPLRGRLALAHRDPAAAVREFPIAVAASPHRRDVLSGLGRAPRLVGDQRGAEPYLKAAADLDTLELLLRDLVGPGAASDPDRLCKLGSACEALGRYPEARAWFSLA